MNEKRRPNLQDLSLYYDGLLDEEKRKEVEAQLEGADEEKHMLKLFECIDSALEYSLPDDRIDALLGDNLKGIHERLIESDSHRRQESSSIWDWLLMPRHILAGVTGLLILFGVFSTFDPMNPQHATVIVSVPPHGDFTQDDPDTGKGDDSDIKTVVVDEAQKQVILAAADFAKRAFSSGYDYAKEQGKPLGESLKVMPETSDLGVALQALTSSGTDTNTQTQKNNKETLSPNQMLARTGTRQLAIGLGASLISLLSVI